MIESAIVTHDCKITNCNHYYYLQIYSSFSLSFILSQLHYISSCFWVLLSFITKMQLLSVFCFLIQSCQMKHNPLTVYTNVGLLKITIWQIYTLQIWQISLLASTHWNPQQMIGSLDSKMTWNAGREQHSSELFKRCSVCPRVGVHHTYILQPGDCNTVKTDKHQKGLEWWIQV